MGLRKIAWFLPLSLFLACGESSTPGKRDGGLGTGGRRDAGGIGGQGGIGGTRNTGGTVGSGGIIGVGGLAGGGAGAGGAFGRGGAGGAGSGGVGVDASVDAPLDAVVDAVVIDARAADVPLRSDAVDVPISIDGISRVDGAPPVCGPFANGGGPVDAGSTANPLMSFFVSSTTSLTGDLGGLDGADARCQSLAAEVGQPSTLWRAYLSVEHDPPVSGPSVNARDRIGAGPWYNARGALVAANLASLHARGGDAAVFLDERGNMINGQWTGSPPPVEHDILTGSNPDGTVAFGKTCLDWTSSAGPADGGVPDGGGGLVARVGHSDGLGPQCSAATSPINYTSWNSVHDNAGCNDTQPLGGAGRIYCFKAQ